MLFPCSIVCIDFPPLIFLIFYFKFSPGYFLGSSAQKFFYKFGKKYRPLKSADICAQSAIRQTQKEEWDIA